MSLENSDIRWKQRFQNYCRAFKLLRSALEDKSIDELSALEQEGLVQRFEYTFELGWKTLKDYLEFSGFLLTEATPRKVIKECAATGIFSEAEINAELYLEMMLARNALSHIYDFERFKQILEKVKEKYIGELEKEYMFFLDKELNSND
jgi:nucleotidyltransferase substrate binding protein (TIGR01987 family)